MLLLSCLARAAPETSPSVGLRLGLSVVPTNLRATVQGLTFDGVGPEGAPLVTTMSTRATPAVSAVALGLYAEPVPWLSADVGVDALVTSFLSNAAKNGDVYGARFTGGAAYTWRRRSVVVELGMVGALRFGGYGVTSFDRAGQPSVTVGDSVYVDDDIGVHVIDVAWQLGPRIAAAVAVAPRWRLRLSVDQMWTVHQRSRINVAGLLADETVAWERVALDDPGFRWTVEGRRVLGPSTLPYDLMGFGVGFAAEYRF